MARLQNDTLLRALRREPTPLRPRVPGVPLDVENLVMNLLVASPDERAPQIVASVAKPA